MIINFSIDNMHDFIKKSHCFFYKIVFGYNRLKYGNIDYRRVKKIHPFSPPCILSENLSDILYRLQNLGVLYIKTSLFGQNA